LALRHFVKCYCRPPTKKLVYLYSEGSPYPLQGAPNFNLPFGDGSDVSDGSQAAESEDGGLLQAAMPALVGGVFAVALRYLNKLISSLPIWRHETQHNDIQHKDTQHKGLICDTQLQCLVSNFQLNLEQLTYKKDGVF
jgi:hypothetical protein